MIVVGLEDILLGEAILRSGHNKVDGHPRSALDGPHLAMQRAWRAGPVGGGEWRISVFNFLTSKRNIVGKEV